MNDRLMLTELSAAWVHLSTTLCTGGVSLPCPTISETEGRRISDDDAKTPLMGAEVELYT